MDYRLKALIGWIAGETRDAKGLLVPISGGSDSALTFWLCRQAQPERTIGIHAGTRETLRCAAWFDQYGSVEFTTVPGNNNEREEMRWARFLAVSLARKAWLVGCRNRTEDTFRTYSLASRVATFLPIAGLWKSDVLKLSALAGVPEEILASSRKADPECGRPQELAEIPVELVDLYLQIMLGESTAKRLAQLTSEQVDYLDRISDYNEFKDRLPIRGPRL